MCEIIQANASKNRNISRNQGAQEVLDSNHFICNLGSSGGVIKITTGDDLSFELSLWFGVSQVELRRGQDWFSVEYAAIGGHEADETFPSDLHSEFRAKL